jgi:hypothetical protein
MLPDFEIEPLHLIWPITVTEQPRNSTLSAILKEICTEFCIHFQNEGGRILTNYGEDRQSIEIKYPGQCISALTIQGRTLMGTTVHTLVLVLGQQWTTGGLAYLADKDWYYRDLLKPDAAQAIAKALSPSNTPLPSAADRTVHPI